MIYLKSQLFKKITAILIVVGILFSVFYTSYLNYRDSIINKQQENLLLIANSTSDSIELYFNEKIKFIENLYNSIDIKKVVESEAEPEASEVLKKILTDNKNEYSRISIYDNQNKLIYSIENDNIYLKEHLDIINDIPFYENDTKYYISDPYKDKYGEINIDMIKPIYNNGKTYGYMVLGINLQEIHEKLVNQVNVGESGYIVVKDSRGIIIMHKSKEQLGKHVIKPRLEEFPEFDWTELEELIEDQLKGEEGTAEYHSSWMDKDKLKRVKKITGYAPVEFSNTFWVVSAQLGYDEINQIILNYLYKMILLTTLIIIVVLYIFNIFKKMYRENKYLSNINTLNKKIRETEAKIYQGERLKALGTMVSSISHEFNNIFIPLVGYSELIRENTQEKETKENIIEIEKSAHRAKSLFSNLLEFSKKEINKKEFNIIKCCEDAIKLAMMMNKKNVKFKTHFQSQSIIFKGNYDQIEHVFLNIFINSIQAADNIGGIVEIFINEEDNLIKIIIKDNGPGIDDEITNNIFEPFETTKETDNGTGLGLYISKSIIENHEGKITCENENEGAKFIIFLNK